MEDLRENIDLVNQNENRASAISFNPYAVYLNGAPGIYGSPFEINLGHKKQVGKILQVQENTYKLVKFDYEGYDGDLSVSISNGSKIEYFLSRNYHDPNCNEYCFEVPLFKKIKYRRRRIFVATRQCAPLSEAPRYIHCGAP